MVFSEGQSALGSYEVEENHQDYLVLDYGEEGRTLLGEKEMVVLGTSGLEKTLLEEVA